MPPDEAMGWALDPAAAASQSGGTPIGAVVLGPDGALLVQAVHERETRP